MIILSITQMFSKLSDLCKKPGFFHILIVIIIIITSSGDLQPSTAIANQSLGKSVSAN